MTKLEAWKKWCEKAHVTDATEYTLEMSSHGKAFSYAWDAAVKAEREACAKLCKNEEATLLHKEGLALPQGNPMLLKMASVANFCAAAIRARGEV